MSSIVETLIQVADVEMSSVKTIKYTDKHKLMVYVSKWILETLEEKGYLTVDIIELFPVLEKGSDEEKGKFFNEFEKTLRKANSSQTLARRAKEAEKAAAKAAKDEEKALAKAVKEAQKAAVKAAKEAERNAAKAAKAAEKKAAKAAAKAAKVDPVQELIRLAATDGASAEQTKKTKKTKKDKEVISTQTNMIDELLASVNVPTETPAAPAAPAVPASAPVDKEAAKAAKDAEKAAAKAAKDAEKAAAKAAKDAEKAAAKAAKDAEKAAAKAAKDAEKAAAKAPKSPPAAVVTTPTKVESEQLEEEVIEDNFEENYENWTFEGKNYYKNKHTNEVVMMNSDGELEMIGVFDAEKNAIVEDSDDESDE